MTSTESIEIDATSVSPKKERIASIDILRGIVMVIMALDHMRDFTHNVGYSPTDLTQTNALLFFTRWITHFCAPIFIFLTGTSAFLFESLKQASKREVARYLIVRGLLLIVFELTIVTFGWYLNFNFYGITLQVIWLIGICMVLMAGLIYLPHQVLLVFGFILVFGHNLLDDVSFTEDSFMDILWIFLHDDGVPSIMGLTVYVAYPIIPWIGVMALGYVFGKIVLLEKSVRKNWYIKLGLGFTSAFILIRLINVYGDPNPWQVYENPTFTLLSFLNLDKYPPSLGFILMTLGPGFLLLNYLEEVKGWFADILLLFGRVPLFFYLIHLPLLHFLAKNLIFIFKGVWPASVYSKDFSLGIGGLYLSWILGLVILYYLCRWYKKLKRTKRYTWMKYI